MGIVDWLRKLGILRYGATKATYTSAKDRPAEFMMDGVMDAEKDLTHLKKPADKPPPSPDSR